MLVVMEALINTNAELIEGMFFGFFFAVLYFAPNLFRKFSGNNAAAFTSNVYINENGSAVAKGRI